MLESYTAAYAVKSWSEPVVNILRDVTATVTLIGILYLILGDKLSAILPADWETITEGMSNEELMDWLEIQNLAGAGVGGFLGILIGGALGSVFGPFTAVAGAGAGGIAGAAAGSYTVEQLEDFQRLSRIAGAIGLAHYLRKAKERLTDPLSPGGIIAGITGR